MKQSSTGDKLVRSLPVESAPALVEMQLDAIAIKPGLTCDRVQLTCVRNSTQPLQVLQQNGALLLHLIFVVGMLVLASAAVPKKRAARRNPVWRGLLDICNFTAQQAILDTARLNRNLLLGRTSGVSTTWPSTRLRPSPP